MIWLRLATSDGSYVDGPADSASNFFPVSKT